ncbi:phosphotransferase [Lentzea tibetensis]|uniref:phosphotransferase n=1 Tax=Lentzea tibetensis TaxID=2591470 RepID=UPI001646B59E|nr:phosphotransferase [Lentzea tibetensis]
MHELFSVELLGEGLDNVAYEVNGMLVVRCSKRGMGNEVELLKLLKDISPLPVPEPIYADERCMAYPKLPGTPLNGDTRLLDTLADFLATLHAMNTEDVEDLVEIDHQPLTEWRDEAVTYAEQLGYHELAEQLKNQALPEPATELVFSHNDLGAEHVLTQDGEITGIIDWTDAAICDPAYDYGLLYRDLGPAALDACPGVLVERVEFYARCTIFEDLVHGRDATALGWLFPESG